MSSTNAQAHKHLCATTTRALVKESFDHQKVEKQCEQMRNETSRMRRLLETNDDVIHKQDAEIQFKPNCFQC